MIEDLGRGGTSAGTPEPGGPFIVKLDGYINHDLLVEDAVDMRDAVAKATERCGVLSREVKMTASYVFLEVKGFRQSAIVDGTCSRCSKVMLGVDLRAYTEECDKICIACFARGAE